MAIFERIGQWWKENIYLPRGAEYEKHKTLVEKSISSAPGIGQDIDAIARHTSGLFFRLLNLPFSAAATAIRLPLVLTGSALGAVRSGVDYLNVGASTILSVPQRITTSIRKKLEGLFGPASASPALAGAH